MFYKKLISIMLAMLLTLGVITVLGITNTHVNAGENGQTEEPATGPNSDITISIPSGVNPGDAFDLTVTEENTGDVPLSDPYVWLGGIDPATGLVININMDDTTANGWAMGKDDPSYVSGDTNEDGILDPGEIWSWVITDLDLGEDAVTLVAKGHATYSNNDVSWPDYPNERDIVNINTEAMPEDQSIVDLLVADDRFETLVTAVEAAGLAETLSGEGPFTIFAPTDDAFDALPEGTLDDLLADIPALTDVLLYHVVGGEVMAADLIGMTEVETLQGQSLTISVSNDDVMVNDAKVVEADIIASNGVIHVIDAVLIP